MMKLFSFTFFQELLVLHRGVNGPERLGESRRSHQVLVPVMAGHLLRAQSRALHQGRGNLQLG